MADSDWDLHVLGGKGSENNYSCPTLKYMVATGQEMAREKKFFKVWENLVNLILSQGKLKF